VQLAWFFLLSTQVSTIGDGAAPPPPHFASQDGWS